VPREFTLWSEQWCVPHEWLESFEVMLRELGAIVTRGGDYDYWDLQVRGGLFGVVRLHMTLEEHGGGRQLIRYRAWPRLRRLEASGIIVLFSLLSVGAALDRAWVPAVVLGTFALLFVLRIIRECAKAMSSVVRAHHYMHLLLERANQSDEQIALVEAARQETSRHLFSPQERTRSSGRRARWSQRVASNSVQTGATKGRVQVKIDQPETEPNWLGEKS
jgi:hypothetical protein